MNGLSLPEGAMHADQMQAVQAAMKQNQDAMAMQARTNALNLAVTLAQIPEHAPITKVLTNARHMTHFIETGHVPSVVEQNEKK